MLRYELPMTDSPFPRQVVPGEHVPYYLALEITASAWMRAMATTLDGVLEPTDLAVRAVNSDFQRELFVGPVAFDVTLLRYGTSSLTFDVDLSQYGSFAARVSTTLVRVDDSRRHALPFSAAQRAGLDKLLTQ